MMSASSHFNLSCDSYKQIVFSGFSRLQEQQEFVDLTLAADGHIVKVHKNVMALASPYIKELLKSTSSDNPVIFLNHVNHKVLNYLLEYIYQGEVNLPQDSIESFLQLSQSLHITGMSKPNISQIPPKTEHTNQNLTSVDLHQMPSCPPSEVQDRVSKDNKSTSELAARITINNDHAFDMQQFGPIQITNVQGNLDSNNDVRSTDCIQPMPVTETFENHIGIPGNMETDATMTQGVFTNVTNQGDTSKFPIIQISRDFNDAVEEAGLIDLSQPANLDQEAKDALKIITQYSITERGSVQIILSRYIYCCHHTSGRGRKHRWRCIDYRRTNCKAYIDSINDRIIERKGLHSHPYHDEKIYKKHKEGKIFTSFGQAKDACVPTERKYSGFAIEDLDLKIEHI